MRWKMTFNVSFWAPSRRMPSLGVTCGWVGAQKNTSWCRWEKNTGTMAVWEWYLLQIHELVGSAQHECAHKHTRRNPGEMTTQRRTKLSKCWCTSWSKVCGHLIIPQTVCFKYTIVVCSRNIICLHCNEEAQICSSMTESLHTSRSMKTWLE